MQRASGMQPSEPIALGLTIGLASPLLAQRADRATISGVVTDNQAAAVPGATVTIKNEETGVENVLVTNNAGAYTSPPLVLGRYSVTVDLTGFKKMVSSGILLQGGGAIRHDVALQVGDLAETVQVKGVQRGQRDPAGREPHRRREVLPGPSVHNRLRRAPGRIGAAHAAGLPADAAERRPDVPRQPVQLPHQRRPGDGDRELLRRRGLRLRERPPAEPREHAAARVRPGSEGHLDDLLRSVRAHQRRLHRVLEQVGHERVPRQRVRVHGRRRVQPEHDLRRAGRNREDADPQRQLRLHARRSCPPARLQRPQQDALLRERRLHAHPLGHDRGLRQHDAHRCVQGRGFRRAADGQPDWHGRAGTADLAGADLRSADDADGEQHPRARSVPEQRHSRRPPAPKRGRLADRAVDGGTRPRRARQQRRRRRDGRPDVGAQRAQHHVPRGPELHAGLQDEHQLLLEPPSLGTQLRGRGWVQLRVRSRGGVGPEHRLLRQRVLPAHLHAPCAPAVRLDRQQQPAGPLHGRVGSLVHGGQSPVGRCELARAAVAGNRQSDRRYRRAGRRTADDAIQRRQRPLHADRARGMAEFRLREERSLAVLERRHVGEGTSHDQGRIRVPPSQFPVPRLGRRGHGGQLQLRPPRHRRVRRSWKQPDPDRRSIRVLPAGAGASVESAHPGVPYLPGDIYRPVRQRRVQAFGQADADLRSALRL